MRPRNDGLILPLPGADVGEGAVGGEVELKRGDGDVAFGERADVGAGFGDAGGRVAADPVIGAVARVGAFVEAAVIDAQSLTGDAKAFEFIQFQKGDVDVEQSFGGQPMFDDILYGNACGMCGGGKVDLADVAFGNFE